MIQNPAMSATMPLGIVMRRAPGATKWADWTWKAVAVLPGAAAANWRLLRSDGEITEYHAATETLELHRAETEAYRHGLAASDPSVYVILREPPLGTGEQLDVVLATVSPYEAQDYADTGEEIIEKIPMPASLSAWVRDFVDEFHEEEVFKKRKRDKKRIDLVEDGVGDARIRQPSDVYRSPANSRRDRLQ